MLYLLYNPKSNAGKTARDIQKYEKKLNKKGFETKSIDLMDEEKTKLAIKAVKPSDGIVIVGGDGTINRLLNDDSFNKLTNDIYVYRSGRGNDFSRNFKTRFFKIEGGFKGFPKISIDNKDYHFVNGMGMGIDAKTCYIQHENFLAGKKVSYFQVAKEAFKTFKPYSLDVSVDGKDYHYDNVWFFVIQNGKYFGGGMKISPKSKINDDKLEISIVHDMKLSKLLTVFPLIFIGKHTIFKKEIMTIEGKDFKAKARGTDILQIDGEIRKNVTSVEVKSVL